MLALAACVQAVKRGITRCPAGLMVHVLRAGAGDGRGGSAERSGRPPTPAERTDRRG